jgi:hypothetical protein
MPTKVALYTLQSEASAPELEGPMDCCEGDTCVDPCVCLEAARVLDWSFPKWTLRSLLLKTPPLSTPIPVSFFALESAFLLVALHFSSVPVYGCWSYFLCCLCTCACLGVRSTWSRKPD